MWARPAICRSGIGTSSARSAPASCRASEALEHLRPLLADPAVLKVGHNLKSAQSVLARYGLEVRPYDDVMLLSYVIDGAGHGHGLVELARLHLDHDATHLRGGLRQRQAADRLRPGAGRARHGLCRRLRRPDAPPARPAQAAARGASGARGSTRRSTGRWSPCSRRWSGAASRSTRQMPARALGRLRPAHGRARGARPTGWPGGRSTSARPSSWARCCSRSRAWQAGAQDPDRQPRARRRRCSRGWRPQGHPLPRHDPRLAPAAEADRHLHRRPDPGDRARRPGPHLLRHGRDLDRASVLERPEPPEHPDPDRGRAQDPRAPSSPRRATSCSPPTTRRSSCACSRTWPGSRR